jgi:glycine/D-amino acid oxidase-like deaminating enzyme
MHFPTDTHGWVELLPVRTPTSTLTGTHQYKWTIIGAGFTGLSCAHTLAALHPNDEILVLEARQVGQGASGRNSGFAVSVSHFSGGFDSNQKQNYARINQINQAGLDLLRGHISQHKIDCAWDENGFYHTAADTASLHEHGQFIDYLHRMDVPHTNLKTDELEKRLGTRLYKAGVHVPQGALVQPAALVRGLADSLPKNVTLAEDTPVLKISKTPRPILHIQHGTVTTDTLILAVNYEAPKLGYLRRRLIGSTLSGSFTRQLTQDELASLGSLSQWGVLSLHSGGATVRLTNDGRICLRNTAEYHGGKLLSDKTLAARTRLHRTAFDKRFPQLSHIPFEYAWSGVEGLTRNGTNFFGQRADHIFLAGGYNGSGVTRGIAFGSAIAHLAGGSAHPLISACMDSVPAHYIPPRPFLDIGAALTVRARFKGTGLDR